MARISKQKISSRISNEISSQLTDTLGRLSANQSGLFVSQLLGKEEQIMLAKRLAIIVLIHEQHTDYAISKTLKVSDTTVSKLRLKYHNKEFDSVVKGIKKNKADYIDFLETLLDIMHMGLPRYAGPNRKYWLANIEKRSRR